MIQAPNPLSSLFLRNSSFGRNAACASLVALASLGDLTASPVVYEPFAYPAGPLDGARGKAEVGLSGQWVAETEGVHAIFLGDDSLKGSHATSGGAVIQTSPGVNKFGGARAITGLQGSGLLEDGATLWVSVVMGYGAGGSPSNARLALALGNAQFNKEKANYWIDDSEGLVGSGVGLKLCRVEDINGRVVATQFKDEASGDFTSGNNDGNWTGEGLEIEAGEHALYVLKIQWGESSVSPEVLTVYRPNLNLEIGEPVSLLTDFTVDQKSYDTLSFARGDSVVLDEIRMGASLADVLPADPTPPSFVVLKPHGRQGGFPMRMTFDKAVLAGAGDLQLYEKESGNLVASIPTTDGDQVTFQGRVVTIDPKVSLVQGREYFVEINSGSIRDTHGNDFGGIKGSETWSFTASLPLVAGDQDGDGLNDNWEEFYFGHLKHDGLADLDQDFLPNFLELETGLNPASADTNSDGVADSQGLSGFMRVERWTNIEGESLKDLFASPTFYQPSNEVYFVRETKTASDDGDQYGLRMSGRIVAPVSGDYRFWLAGNGQSQLFLSDNATRFRRKMIASVSTASGEEGWDDEESQKSALIPLVAGEEYYLEVVMKEGGGPDHLAVAWQYPGQPRQVIPDTFIKTHIEDPADLDQDGLLDAWEVSQGLDPQDNGSNDLRQSAYLDWDNDGYRNFEEYHNGGNPLRAGGHRGSLALDLWPTVDGNQVKDLVKSASFAKGPDSTTLVGSDLTGIKDGKPGLRLRGTITPPESGDYVFDLSASFSGELWLGETESRFSKKKLAWTKWPSSHQEWKGKKARHGKAQSEGVYLVGGRQYYLEALVKGGQHSNHLSLGWSRIPSSSWQTANVGPATGANWTAKEGAVTASITGGYVGGTADEFTYRYLTLEGDFDLSMKVESLDATTPVEEVGLMARQSLDVDSPHAFMIKRSNGSVVLNHRVIQGDRGRTEGGNYEGSPYQWVRLKRVGDGFQGYISMDGKTWGRRGRVTIPMGEKAMVGIVLSGGKSESPTKASLSHFSFSLPEQIELIPASALTSVRPDRADLNDNNLPDDWEIATGLRGLSKAEDAGEYGDPDGDLLSNFEEYQMGTDPLKLERVPGYLSQEVWTVGDLSIRDFVRSPEFANEPNEKGYLGSTEYLTFDKHHHGQRIRGGLVAPVSGYYRFWISGDRYFELWLSKDSSKFNRRKLPSIEQEELDNSASVKFRHFDENPSQASELFFLEAGQEYYLEILHQDNLAQGHFSVAWSYTDQKTGVRTDREIIPAAHLRSYIPDPNDLDDDYLPDDWEVANGLDPKDNGSFDPSHGGFGDFDGDGLTNAEEFQAGTKADAMDSDGDGVSDYDEVKLFGTDSLARDVAPFRSVQKLSGSSFVASLGDWDKRASSALGKGVRGWVEYEIDVPTAGIHLLDLAVKSVFGGQLSSEYEFIFSVDGHRIDRVSVQIESGHTGQARVLTPWLTQGSHRVRVFNDNALTARRISFENLELLSAQGPDQNHDNIPDWVTLRLQAQNGIDTEMRESKMSPVQLQGRVRYPELMSLPNGGTLHRSAGDRWYVDLDLKAHATTNFDIIFENGGIVKSQSIRWVATNLLEESALFVRKGDTLLLTAHQPGEIGKGLDKIESLSLEGENFTFEGRNPLEYTFRNPGVHTIALTYKREDQADSRQTRSVTVTVVEVPEIDSPVCVPGHFRPWDLPALPDGVELEIDSRILVRDIIDLGEGATRYMIAIDAPETRYAQLRMKDGPILSSIPIRSMTLRDAEETSVAYVRDFDDGSYQVDMPVVVSQMWPDVRVHHHIFLAGVTFNTGEVDNDFYADDFDELGQALITFIKTGSDGSACHRTSIFQGDVRIALFD